jgi:hypothetical protein
VSDTTPITHAPPTIEPRRFRRTRIAVSVFFGVVSLLLVVLWVRSYWQGYALMFKLADYRISIASANGVVGIAAKPYWPREDYLSSYPITEEIKQEIATQYKFGFGMSAVPQPTAVCPIWLWILSCIFSSVWLPCRDCPNQFSLRTMLIATTLLAVALGMLVWAAG